MTRGGNTAPAVLPLRLASRVVLATARGPGRTLWVTAARALARRAGRHAAAGVPDTSVYTRGGLGRGDFVPGLSDVDVIVVAAPDPGGPGRAAERIRSRWRRRRARHPVAYAVFGEPRVLDDGELAELVGSSAFTYGLGDGADRAAFAEDSSLRDRLRLLDKPGLAAATGDWVLLAGRERRPAAPTRTPAEECIACWLELAFYWRHAFPACVHPDRPRTALLCVKLVAEPARILLQLTVGEGRGPRADVLRRALALLPEEEPALRLALETERLLPRRPAAPLAESVAALARLSRRIADLVTERAFADGADLVRLEGADPRRARPLCDWRSVVSPTHVAELVLPGHGSPADPTALREAALEQRGPTYVALRDGALLVLPAVERERNRLRAVQCPASDPVSFALLDERSEAAFPRTAGWSIEQVARRAVAEHRARLAARAPDLVTVLGAARAALLRESVRSGTPSLAVTPVAVLEALDGRVDPAALDEVRSAPVPSPAAVAALADRVRELPELR